MPETSLRAYGREIDELIEQERLEEAIAHCRYILQTYPKHLETYRHLGKAYLEAKRYGDAADIFQRVLSAVPDDFVSHVGMAIFREDEGNLDAAIWHMERAFETNPSNPAIQQEMKRLISRRDGLEPHKVRLTRGALARMYAHGELFSQAIAELRSALQEDAERPDLQVLLASMYWQTDQRGDAISVSNQILEKLPYCAEANRILAANLQANDRVEEAAVYHRRLANLDPYAAFVESALADAKSIEESAVQLERLDWVAGEPLPSAAPGQPGWATTLGMEMQEESADETSESAKPAQTGPLPSWLEPGEPPPFEAAAEKELREEMEVQASDGSGELPEPGFLEDMETETPAEEDAERSGLGLAGAAAGITAGVLAGAGDHEDEPTEDSEADILPESEAADVAAAGLAAGMIAGGGEEGTKETEEPEAEIVNGGEAAAAAGMFDQVDSFESADSGGDVGEKRDGTDDPDVEAPLAGEELLAEQPEVDGPPEGDIPDWMQEAGWGESKGEFEDAPVSFSEQELSSLEAGEIPAEVSEDDDVELTPAELPDWIHDIAPEEVEGSPDGAGDESLPGWINAEAPSEDESAADAVAPSIDIEAKGDDAETDASFPKSETDTGEIPTWITSDPPGATETIVTWLEDRSPDSLEDDEAASQDLPDWMRDTGPLDDSPESEPIEVQPEELPSAEIAMEEAGEVAKDVASEEPPAAEPISDLTPEPSSEDPASESWLSAVAAVAADEEPAPSSAERVADGTPDLLSETTEGSEIPASAGGLGLAAAAAAGMLAGKDEEELKAAAAEEIPEEARDIEAEVAPPSEAEGAASGQELDEKISESEAQVESSASSSAPDWLEEIGTLPDQPSQTDSADWLEGLEINGEETAPEPAADTPDWLKGLAEEGADGDESGATPAADWLREIGQPGSVAEEQAAEVVDSASMDDQSGELEAVDGGGAPDWVKSAVDEEPGGDRDDAEAESPIAPAEEDDEVMDWLQDLAAKQAEEPDEEEFKAASQVEATAPVLEDRDIPDAPEEGLEWLEQLADQRGIDVDVSVPGQATPPPSSIEPEAEPEPATAPGWLGRMATQPIPKVDMEALEAAAQGEGVSPDAETIDTNAAEVQAQLEEAALELDSAEAASDDVTIEAHASDLQPEIEAERVATPSDPEPPPTETTADADTSGPEDEIPDWLIAAAEQAEPPSDVSSELPVEFADLGTEPELDSESAGTGGEVPPTEEPEPEFTEDTVQEASISEEISGISESDASAGVLEMDEIQPAPASAEMNEIQPSDVSTEETELAEPVAIAADEVLEQSEIKEAEAEPEPIAEEPAAETPKVEVEPPAVEASEAEVAEEPPAPEVKKKEDLLERSRQALASGDTASATEMYSDMIKRKKSLESVIEDLRIAVDRAPDNADLWQVLGDAYMRDDRTDEAIDAYRKGMEAA